MRLIGIILISVGLALLFFIAFYYLQESNREVSPLPEDRGVKVIFVTPTE